MKKICTHEDATFQVNKPMSITNFYTLFFCIVNLYLLGLTQKKLVSLPAYFGLFCQRLPIK